MVHNKGSPHTVSPQSGQHTPNNQSRQGNPVQDRSHNQVNRIMAPNSGNNNALPSIVPMGIAGSQVNNFADGTLKNNQQQNKFTDGRLGRQQQQQKQFGRNQKQSGRQESNIFTDGGLGSGRTNIFTEGRITQKGKMQGFSKQKNIGSVRLPTPVMQAPSVQLNIPGQVQGNVRRQVSYDQMYGTTGANQNALKDKYDRANLRVKKKGLKTISTGTSLLDGYKSLGRR